MIVRRVIFFIMACASLPSALADEFIAKGNDAAIISNVCLYDSADGINKITNITSEDAGLKITLTSNDHATQLLYDVAGEIETITTLGTWAAPTASNVRFKVDSVNGCYEFQFAANSFEDGTAATLTIEDTSTPTFLDEDLTIQIWASGFFDLLNGTTSLMTSRQAGNVLETTIVSAAVPTAPTLTAGASNDDAYNNMTAVFVGGTEECERQVTDYAQVTKTLTIRSACPFTLAAADTVRIHVGVGDALAVVDSVADSNASAIAALNDITSRSVWAVDATDEQTLGTFGQLHGDPLANTETIYDAVVLDAAGTNVAADIIALKAETALIVADTGELQTDDVPGLIAALNNIAAGDVWAVDATGQQTLGTFGQLHGDPITNAKTLYAALVTDATGASVTADVATAQADLDLLTGTDGATLATAQANYAPAKAGDTMALTAAAVDLVWDEIIEDSAPTFTARCAIAIAMAYTAGEWTQAGSVITYKDSGGVENRIVGTVQSPGFDTITITCP